jgi:glycosyltransferase involved in cell wall biosynthesis
MKIMIYFNSMFPAGGIERVISKHIAFLETKHEVILITKDLCPSFYNVSDSVVHESLRVVIKLDMNSRLKRIFQIGCSFWRVIKRLKEKIFEHNPDIIYVASPLNLLEVFFVQLSGRKLLVTEHSSFSSYNSIYKFIARALYKRVCLLTVPTKDDFKYYKSIGIANHYLPNPLSFFPEQPSTLENKVVLNVGRFTDDKRHELLIHIWSLSKERNNGWKLKIIGKGENEDKMRGLIAKLGLENSVILMSNTKEIVQEFCSASIFLLTSRAEGFGLVLAEAMSCGVPCVAFDCPSGPKDIIDNNKNGYLIKEGDLQSYVDRLDNLMANHGLRKRLGDNARIDIRQFDENNICEKLVRLVDNHFIKIEQD